MSASISYTDSRPLGEVAKVYSGGTPSRSVPRFWDGTIPWVTTAEIGDTPIVTTAERITEDGLRKSAAKLAPVGTLLMAMYGQGKTRGKTSILGIPAAMNQACAAIEPHAEVSPRYLLHYLQAHYEDIRSLSNSGSQENLSGKIVRQIPICYPELAEQKRISAVLDAVSDAAASLEQLIAKKRAIKQGLVQQLLTGRTRLSGFREKWSERPVGSLIDGLAAGTSVRSIDGVAEPAVLKTSAVRDGKFNPREVKTILAQDVARASCAVVADSVIVSRMNTPAMVGDVGYVEQAHPGLYLPDRLWLARPRPGVGTSMRWLAALLSHGSTAQAVRDLATGTSNSMKNIPKSRLLALHVPTPPSDEQRALAEVLRDADMEIEALERRLEATRAIKQGMMQELFTGCARLVGEGAA